MSLCRIVSLMAFGASLMFGTVLFDFESLPTTTGGALTSVSQTVDGVTLTITRESGGHFDIEDQSAVPDFFLAFGTRSLSPLFDTSDTAFVGNFSSPVDAVSIRAWSDNPTDADTLLFQWFSGPNATGLIGSASMADATKLGTDFVFYVLGTGDNGISSIRFIGGNSGSPSSFYFDNVAAIYDVNATPEPGSVGLVGLGLAACGLLVKRRSV
jgi:hypothetical protein